jgi:uncharacterized protein YjbI with pentapeptide repeats
MLQLQSSRPRGCVSKPLHLLIFLKTPPIRMVDPGGLRPPGPEPGFEEVEIQGKSQVEKRFGIKSLQKSLSAQIKEFEDAPFAAYCSACSLFSRLQALWVSISASSSPLLMANEEHIRILKQGVKAWNMWRADNLGWADLRLANLREADLARADLVEADLGRANLIGANLGGAILSHANLQGANLRDADVRGAMLNFANLGSADLSRANLRGADLGSANLRDATLRGTDLSWASLQHAELYGCRLRFTWLADVDLSEVKGLDTVVHDGPSSVGIDTFYNSKGRIPAIFLRGAGVPEDLINVMSSLMNQALEFYSCFISYSSKDQEFATRLRADLQSKGVRCWFAPEDLKIGDKLRPSFDEAIRVHDKVIVLLSEDSVKSVWVEKEVETAFEKERQQNRTVLFPIRLDDTVMETQQAWAADIRRTRHIGDFRNWKDHGLYKDAFDRLLRDLKSQAKAQSTQN